MTATPSILAWIVLLSWPIVAFILVKKYELQRAVILSVLVPYLFLPMKTEFDLPLVPPIDKTIIPGIGIILALMAAKQKFLQLPKPPFLRALLLLLFIAPLLTYYTNRYPLVLPAIVLPGLGVTDILGMLFNNFFSMYVPFMLGYTFLARPNDHELLVRTVLLFGLIYSLPVLWEIRLSPQLHRNLYGFFPHDWGQMVRYGGFRPVVFLGHGLVVAYFMALSVLCAFTVWRNEDPKKKGKALLAFLYLCVVLFLCKSVGSMLLAMIFVTLLWFLWPRMQLKIAHYLMIVVILFPVFRSSVYYPDEWLAQTAADFDPERAQSLIFRFNNENLLIERAAEKSWFGWGGWGRNFLFDERTGESLIVVDGYWIIIYSMFGWFGYLSMFCVYAFSVMAQARRVRKDKKYKPSPYTVCLCFMLALNLIDSIVNASVNILTALISGALWANVYYAKESSGKAKVTAEAKPSGALGAA